ncbi:MAG TPA: oligosaccharide flippase family protein [Methanofastidiosum sp.]|nr:oligosaccharide flippase family protein [Methanofastidiosum sp.]
MIINEQLVRKIKESEIFISIKHAKNYFSANIATKAIGVISLPIFTRLFTQAEYGIYSVYLSYLEIFTVILSLNCVAAVGRYYYEKTEDFKEFLGTTLTLLIVTYCITVSIVLILYSPLANLMGIPNKLLYYMIVGSFFLCIYSVYTQILSAQRKSKESAKISIVYGYSIFILAVIITYNLTDERYLGKIWASLIIGIISNLYFINKLKEGIKFSLNKKHIIYILNYSIPLIPYSLSSLILSQFDRIMINNIINSASAGLYGVAYTVGSLVLTVLWAVMAAIYPKIMEFFNKSEFERADVLVKRVFSIFMMAAFGIILFGREIILILADPKFHIASGLVPIIALGHIFYGMAIIYNSYIDYKKKMIYLSFSVLSAGVINIILNAIYIPQYGYVAAAYTTVISYFLMFLFNWVISKYILKQKTIPLWLLWKPFILLTLFMIIIFGISYLDLSYFITIIIKVTFLIIYSVALIYPEIKHILPSLIK